MSTALLGLKGGNELRYPDERDYNALAHSILSGNGYVSPEGIPTAFRPPGWPLVISALYCISPHPLIIKLMNAVAYAGVGFLLSILVARITPEGRVFAPLLVLLYPVGAYTASTLYPQTFGTFLFLAILLLIGNRRHTIANTCFAATMFGLLVLSMPTFLLITPLILAGLRQFNIKHVALFLLFAALVVAPWTIRNACVLGGFTPVSTNSGINLLLGNSENAGSNTGVNVDISRYIKATRALSEKEKDVRLRQYAISWMRENPRAAITLYFFKVLNYFSFRNQLYVRTEGRHTRDIIMFISYYPLLLLTVLRLWMYKRHPVSPAEAVLYLIYFGNAFVSAIFFTRIRFRIPFDTLLIAIGAVTLGLIVREITNRYMSTKTNAGDAEALA